MDFEGSFHPTTTFVREVMSELDQGPDSSATFLG